MFSFLFNKRPDPINDEIKKLKQASRRLEREAAELQSQIGMGNSGVTDNEQSPRVVLLPNSEASNLRNKSNPSRLKVQGRKLRNRFLILCAVVIILLLLILKAVL
ncbi:MAG: hypothetical protein AAGA18_09020 [Verrucomicrobiota bacterium]